MVAFWGKALLSVSSSETLRTLKEYLLKNVSQRGNFRIFIVLILEKTILQSRKLIELLKSTGHFFSQQIL
jgi:hypothetical protein